MLKFNEETHEYFLEGKKLISVTQLMRKHGLAPDYSNVDETVLRAKAERGTLIHKEIEEYIKKGVIGWSSEVIAFADYRKHKQIEIIASEEKVHNDIVAGTVDLLLREEGQPIIADIKTTYQIHKESVSWQLSIYLYLMDDEIAYSHFKGQVFHFDKEGLLTVVDIPLKPFEEVEKLLYCERNGLIYKQDLTTRDKILLNELADTEALIKKIEDQKKQAEEEAKVLREKLLEAMEKHSIKSFENDKIKLTYVAPTTRSTIDSKRLKEELPDIAEQYTKTSEVKATLKITLKGE